MATARAQEASAADARKIENNSIINARNMEEVRPIVGKGLGLNKVT